MRGARRLWGAAPLCSRPRHTCPLAPAIPAQSTHPGQAGDGRIGCPSDTPGSSRAPGRLPTWSRPGARAVSRLWGPEREGASSAGTPSRAVRPPRPGSTRGHRGAGVPGAGDDSRASCVAASPHRACPRVWGPLGDAPCHAPRAPVPPSFGWKPAARRGGREGALGRWLVTSPPRGQRPHEEGPRGSPPRREDTRRPGVDRGEDIHGHTLGLNFRPPGP